MEKHCDKICISCGQKNEKQQQKTITTKQQHILYLYLKNAHLLSISPGLPGYMKAKL